MSQSGHCSHNDQVEREIPSAEFTRATRDVARVAVRSTGKDDKD